MTAHAVSGTPGLHLVVDGANVVGSRPDGWWRDRAGAARRLAGELVAALVVDPEALVVALGRGAGDDLTVHLVLEGEATRLEDLPTHPSLVVVDAPADGDTTIAELVTDLTESHVVLVTSDRELRERVQAGGATVVGSGTFLRHLPSN